MTYLCFRRPFTFTPLHKGSPYDPATLGFLFLAVRGAFILPAKEAYERGDFRLREDAKSWYLLCEIDQSSGAINVNIFIFFLFSYSSLDSSQGIFCLLRPQSLTTHACRRMMKNNFTQYF